MGTEGYRNYEANTIVAKIARTFEAKCWALPGPAAVRPDEFKVVSNLDQVKKVLSLAASADIVLTPLAAANTTPEASTLVRFGGPPERSHPAHQQHRQHPTHHQRGRGSCPRLGVK